MKINKANFHPRKILVVRTDRLGDVILSLPVLTALKKSFSGVHLTMMLRSYTAAIVKDYPDVDDLIIFEERKAIKSASDLWRWAKILKRHQFDAVIILHPTTKLALLCYLARIPIRVGTGFRAYSFLFNQRVYHHRKNAQKHELDLNLDLVEKIGATLDLVEFKIYLPESARNQAQNFIRSLSLKSGQRRVIIHPGSGGSARDWPLARFVELSDRLHHELNAQIILTGGPDETALIDAFGEMAQFKPAVWQGSEKNGLKELGALIQQASLFISNSTGPLHLAVAVGTPVIGFFCPIIPCLPQRWGPYGHLHDSVLMPPVPHCKACTKEKCQYYDCMQLIDVETAFDLAIRKLNL